jgi:hypothetical protein
VAVAWPTAAVARLTRVRHGAPTTLWAGSLTFCHASDGKPEPLQNVLQWEASNDHVDIGAFRAS